jgi:iron complex outermembrane recepter protein
MPTKIAPLPARVRGPLRPSFAALYALCAASALAQTSPPEPQSIPGLVVTGTRVAADPQNLPMSIDVVGAETLRDQTLQVNLSESLQRVPGINVQNRGNYAQDLQISSRGFGARASFGVRGVRLFTDGIPASQPDGQGQVSHFSLGGADRIEVLRGPFSVLYGNASGGVMQIFTETAPQVPEATLGLAFGSNATSRASLRAGGRLGDGGTGVSFDASRFATDGIRPQSAATKTGFNSKLTSSIGDTKLTFIANHVDIDAQDALGLSRAEFDANPYQTNATATQFNTRKDTRQGQFGVKAEHAFSKAHAIEATLYAGERRITQWQSIPVATQTAATQPGGVIDFERAYGGVDVKYVHRADWGTLIFGANYDNLNEDRRGYENFVGTTLGVTGRLRREEENNVHNQDFYAQASIKLGPQISLTAGVRASEVRFESVDKYIVAGRNPDDSGSAKFSKTTPAVGVSFAATKALSLYASAGRGFETPTFNELAYRAGGQTGLNFDLKPAVSDSVEIGAKWRSGGLRATAALFNTKTTDEIVTLTNSGGRSAFQNAGKTSRKGGEVLIVANVLSQFDLTVSATLLDAKYDEAFKTCGAPPCTTPTVIVAAGNKMPGLPAQAYFAEAKWTHPSGLVAAIDLKRQGRIYVNDTNTDAAIGVTTSSARVGYAMKFGKLSLDAGARLDNIGDKRYAGTVIVNEGNSRFFETAAGRSWLATLSATMTF